MTFYITMQFHKSRVEFGIKNYGIIDKNVYAFESTNNARNYIKKPSKH